MSNKKIFKNTLYLYSRQIVLILINLYSLRIVLNALGVENFGIYTVISGVVALASFLPSAMSSATQRFFSFELGKGDNEKISKIFSVNLIIYALIGVVALVILEGVGVLFVNAYLNISSDMSHDATLLYQISIFTFMAGLLSSPYLAMIIAHEDMEIFSLVSIYEAVAKLAVAFYITYLTSNKLVSYGAGLLIVSVTTYLTYLIVCKRRYHYCHFNLSFLDLSVFKEILSFTGWTLFGQFTTVARNQAVTILLNQAFNPAVAAARAISFGVANQVTFFSVNFNTSLYPPIIKYYAANQKDQMFDLLVWGSKLTFFLCWLLFLPLFIEMDTILTLWLIIPPQDSVYFSQLALIESVIMAISLPLTTAARAPGQMGGYELTLGSIQLFILIASWGLLSVGYPAESVFIVAIAANVLMFFVRLNIVGGLIDIDVNLFLQKVVGPMMLVALSSVIPAVIVKSALPSNLFASGFLVLFCIFTSTVMMLYLGFDASTRQRLLARIRMRLGFYF